MLKKISARSVLLVLQILKNWHKNKAEHSYWPAGCVWFAAFEGCHHHHCPTGDVDSILAAAAFGPECSQEPGPAGRCCPQTETSGSALQPIPGRPSTLQKETTLLSLADTSVSTLKCSCLCFSALFSIFTHDAEVAEVIYQLITSPADRSSSKHILHTHPNWLFLWRRCLLQICHLGQKCVTALSLVAQHRLKNITLKLPSVPPKLNIFRHTCAANQTEIESRHNGPIFHLQKSNVRFRHETRNSPSMNTALRTANTAPTTMLFWEAARRWRSQDDRIPTGRKIKTSQNCRITLSGRKNSHFRQRMCVRTAFVTWFYAILRNRIALWRLKKVQQNPAGEPGSGFWVLLAAGWREETKIWGVSLISESRFEFLLQATHWRRSKVQI